MSAEKADQNILGDSALADYQDDSIDQLMDTLDDTPAANDGLSASAQELPEDLEDEIADLLDSDFSEELDGDVDYLLEEDVEDESLLDLSNGSELDIVEVITEESEDDSDDGLLVENAPEPVSSVDPVVTPPAPEPPLPVEATHQEPEIQSEPETPAPVFEAPDPAPNTSQASPFVAMMQEESNSDPEAPDLLVPGPVMTSSSGNSVMGFIAVVIGLVALSFGGIAIWVANGMNTELDELKQSIATLSTQLEQPRMVDESPQVQEAIQSIQLINERLNDLGVETQNLGIDVTAVRDELLHESNLVQAAFGRLKGIENSLGSIKGKLAASPKPAAAPKPVKPKPPVAKTRKVEPVPIQAFGWVVNLATFTSKAPAEKLSASLKSKGVPALLAPFKKNTKQLYRVQVGGFSSYEAAKAGADKLRVKHGLSGAWVGKSG